MQDRIKKCVDALKTLACKTINDCTMEKTTTYFGKEEHLKVLLPSGDEKYVSFWVRDAAMMAESGLVSNDDLKRYIEIIALKGQNGASCRLLGNGLTVPAYAVADHINYDGCPVFFPGTYDSGQDQGDGTFGSFPPFCDNYYFVLMVDAYLRQSSDYEILDTKYNSLLLLNRLEYAFAGYNLDEESGLCCSDAEKHTVDWGFVDTIKKSGKLLMASLLRYNAACAMERMFEQRGDNAKRNYYFALAQKIRTNVLDVFYDAETGWFYSATGIGHQHDVWATAYAVFSGITLDERTLSALSNAYAGGKSVVDGYVRHILTDEDFSDSSAWESAVSTHNEYQNGAYWATPTGWYAYALYKHNGSLGILEDFLRHTSENEHRGAPFEWMDEHTEQISGLNYGTSGVLAYIGAKRILEETENRPSLS